MNRIEDAIGVALRLAGIHWATPGIDECAEHFLTDKDGLVGYVYRDTTSSNWQAIGFWPGASQIYRKLGLSQNKPVAQADVERFVAEKMGLVSSARVVG